MRADPSIVVIRNSGESAEFEVFGGWKVGGGRGMAAVLAVWASRKFGVGQFTVDREMERGDGWAVDVGKGHAGGHTTPYGGNGVPFVGQTLF